MHAPASEPTITADGTARRYRIEFRPRADLFRKGIDPLGFLDELRELGDARVTAHVDAVPPLEELNPTDCLLAWTVDLVTDAGRARVEEVFLFLDEPGQVTIDEIDGAGRPDGPPDRDSELPRPFAAGRTRLGRSPCRRRPGSGSTPSSSTGWWAWRASLRC